MGILSLMATCHSICNKVRGLFQINNLSALSGTCSISQYSITISCCHDNSAYSIGRYRDTRSHRKALSNGNVAYTLLFDWDTQARTINGAFLLAETNNTTFGHHSIPIVSYELVPIFGEFLASAVRREGRINTSPYDRLVKSTMPGYNDIATLANTVSFC